MKKFLMITIATLTMVSCAVVDKTIVAEEHNQTKKTGEIAGKMVAMINDYTDKINAVESVDDLFFISEKCYKEKVAFERNNAEEITAFKSTLTEEEQTTYDKAISDAMSKFEKAVNIKANILADEQEAANEKK